VLLKNEIAGKGLANRNGGRAERRRVRLDTLLIGRRLIETRMSVMSEFLTDYLKGLEAGRYAAAPLQCRLAAQRAAGVSLRYM